MERPCVSVIVPVFNRERLLVRCLDTLVYQTLENIEILVVDDFSTDNSYEVALDYKKRFPDKVKVFKNTYKGVAYAKNLGIANAEGEYITFVDSDDYVEYWAYEKMYARAKKNDFEILCAPMYKISENGTAIWGRITKKGIVDILFSEIFSLCTKLIRRDIFERFGDLPLLRIGEDSSYIYSVFSYLEGKIAYYEQPYYYYELSANSVSQSNTELEVIEDILRGNEYVLNNCNPEYLSILKCIVIRRTRNMMFRYEDYKDCFVNYLKTHRELYESNLYLSEKCPLLFNQLNKLLEETECEIPHSVYVNGFGKKVCEEYITYLQNYSFRAGGKVYVLDESNCDVAENAFIYEAYKEKQYQFVGEYFVTKKIYENGGIFISPKMKLNCFLDALMYKPVFFSYVDDTNFSGDIFGAVKNNELIKAILDTYSMQELYENQYETISSRIKTILIVKEGIRLYACERKLLCGGSVFDPSKLLHNIESKMNFCEYVAEKDEEGTQIYRNTTLQCIVRNLNAETKKAAMKNVGNSGEKRSIQNNTITELLREKEEMLNSTSWRITEPLRKLGDFMKRNKRR